MKLHLRQICLVARELTPAIDQLSDILGIEPCYIDPQVGVFGLENTLLPIGRNFLEVVAPIRDGATAERYLDRRGGDGGYMVITQADSRAAQQAVRARALENGVRVAHESERDGWSLCQLHPGDLKAAFLEVECDADPTDRWMPAGGHGWEDKVRQDVTIDMVGVELQGPDPVALADLWSKVLGAPVERAGGEITIALANAALRFVEAVDGRGPGLGGIDLAVKDPKRILERAKGWGRDVAAHRVDICGTRFYLRG